MKYYLIAGEASGDMHGANLLKELIALEPNSEFRYLGGEKMEAVGGTLVKHYKEQSFMGFVEVIKNLRTILRSIQFCKNDILQFKPDALILIDYPGFNLKIAKFAKAHNIKVYYYISPKIWAWNQKRGYKIKQWVDKMFCIFPFEVDFYKQFGMQVEYVGNPLMDAISAFNPNLNFQKEIPSSNKKIIALLPGSRKLEIKLILPEMWKMKKHFPQYDFIIAGAPNFDPSFYEETLNEKNLNIVFNNTYNLLHISEAALVTSGTATLECALLGVPEVVLYKGSGISIAIAKMLIKVKFISLVNLIMDKEVVKELIQENCNEENIKNQLSQIIIGGKNRNQMLDHLLELKTLVGPPGASTIVAQHIHTYQIQK